jgi:cellulose biosynthesis protein BcsQ
MSTGLCALIVGSRQSTHTAFRLAPVGRSGPSSASPRTWAARGPARQPRYLELHRSLADALGDEVFAEYDLVLIDCPPDFTMVTRTAIVVCDHLLVPAKADYLSTLGGGPLSLSLP